MSSFEIQTMFGRVAATAAGRGAWTAAGTWGAGPPEIVNAATRAGRYVNLAMQVARFYARPARPETLVNLPAAGILCPVLIRFAGNRV